MLISENYFHHCTFTHLGISTPHLIQSVQWNTLYMAAVSTSARGEQLGVRYLAQGNCIHDLLILRNEPATFWSHGQFFNHQAMDNLRVPFIISL